ncbi:hypothetical protein EYF80_047603 [Liparis tanakae]|uniref:Uncharacterized protein n=1 Tax=Liparis tanakae TaxID=230148 RepID=A0A4Z2FM68_9TELE|nr:hypothetical protein EYF80_047603 [Liparis tanakae]
MEPCLMHRNLQLLGADVHLEQGVTEDVSEAAAVEVAVGPSVVLLVVDLRELQAAVLQQLVVVQLLLSSLTRFWSKGVSWSTVSGRTYLLGRFLHIEL